MDTARADRAFLTPAEAARYLGMDPHGLRLQARIDPGKLGFPVVCVGSRVKIPKKPFLLFMGLEQREENSDGNFSRD